MTTTSFVPRHTIHREGAFASSARALEAICLASSNSGQLEVQNLVTPEKTLFAFPASDTKRGEPTVAVAVDGRIDSNRVERIRKTIVAGLSSETHGQDNEQLERELAETASVIELVEMILESPSAVDAARRLAVAVQSLATGSRVFVGICRSGKSSAQVLAASDSENIDRRSPNLRAVEASMNRVLDGDEHAGSDFERAIAVPLRTRDHEPVGVLLVLEADAGPDGERLSKFLQAAAPSLALALHSTTRRRRGRLSKSQKTVAFRQHKWFVVSVGLLFAVAMGLAIPATHRVESTVRIEPEHRRYVSAPFDGILERALVKPGDVVKQGEIIAKLDGQSIGWKRAAVIAEQNQARKKRDAAQATRNYAEQQIAQLEIEQQDLELKLLDDRIGHLEISSPVDGIVTSGDLARVEGAPIETGQSLFEIAPLDRLIAELEVHDRRIAYVAPGQLVDILIDAYPGQTWKGTIASVHPRAELRNNDNVFVAEVEIENGDRRLRPGMKGRASIAEQRRPFGWIFLHEPIEAFVKHWFW